MGGGGPASFSADELGFAAKRDVLQFPDHVLHQLVAALDSGMHVVLTGPAGTGKTTLAHLVADLAQQAMLCTGYLPATATAEWSVAQTIGSIQDTAEGPVFLPGMVPDSIESGCWLVIAELNRADVQQIGKEGGRE